MKQKLRVFLTLLLCAVASVGWGEEVTFTAGTDKSPTTVTKDGITVDMSTMSRDDNYRCYANSDMKIYSVDSKATITKIEFTCTASGTSNYGPGNFSYSGDEGEYTFEGKNGTWEGSATSVSLSASVQVRMTQIVVTYIPATSNKVATPTINGTENFYPSTEVSITCNTDGATITYSIDDGNTWTAYSDPFTLTETTTVKAKATKTDYTESDIAEKTFTKVSAHENIAALTSETEANTYYVMLNNAVVTYTNGNYAYIQDVSGAVVMYKSGHGLNAGDVLNGTAEVVYQIRNGNPQITNISGVTPVSGNAPDPTTIASSEWNTPINTVLSQYFKITGATITQNNGKYYVQLGGESVQLYGQGDANPVSVSDLEATYTVIGFPTLYNATAELQIYEQPIAETATRQELTMTFTGGTLEFTDASEFVAPTLSITNEGGDPVSGLTIAYESSNTNVANVDVSGNVMIGSEFGTATITASFAGNIDYVPASASYTITYTNASQGSYTWDLSKASYDANPTENLVTWSSDFATMTNAKGSSNSGANNYLGGDSNNRTSTRFYNGNILTVTPSTSYSISSVVFTANSENYASALMNSTWTNAMASVSGTTVTIIPTDGSSAVSAKISATCGFTGVTVNYNKDNREEAGISFSAETLSITQGKEYTAPTFNNANNVEVTFATNNADVASWNNGLVLGAVTGTAVITATFEGDGNYKPATATLTVTVKEDLNFVDVVEGCGIYQKITSASDLEAGKRYLIVYETQDNDLNDVADIYNGVNNKIGQYVEMPRNDEKVDNTNGTATHPIVLQSAGSGNWYLMDGDNFLYWTSGNNLYISDEVSQNGNTWSINFGVDGMSIKNVNTPERYLQFNASSPRFACYTGTQNDVVLYKELMETPLPEIITVSVNTLATDGSKFYSTLYYGEKNLKIPAGITASGVSLNGTKLVKTEALEENDVIGKGTAVLLTADEAGDYEFTVVTDNGSTLSGENLLRGNDEDAQTTGGDVYYQLSRNANKDENSIGFYWGAANGGAFTNKAHRAYLAVSAEAAKAITGFAFGDMTDSIKAIDFSPSEKDKIYNLSGQRVNKTQKGVYIVNGKKVVVR